MELRRSLTYHSHNIHERPRTPVRPLMMELTSTSLSLRLTILILLTLLLMAIGAGSVAANGVPVQIFLDYLPFKSTWEPASAGRGVAVVSANDELVRVMAQNLPTPPQGRSYFAWLERVEGGFLAVGPLRYATDGTASLDQHMADLPYSETFSWVLVSVEVPENIGATPAAEIALAGKLPNPVALPPASSQAQPLLPVTGAELGGNETNRLPVATPLLVGLGFLSLLGWMETRRSRSRVTQRIQRNLP